MDTLRFKFTSAEPLFTEDIMDNFGVMMTSLV